MRLRWTDRARRDLLSIGGIIARENPQGARGFLARLQVRARRAARFPRSGRIVPEFGREDLREIIEGNYRIVVRVRKASVEVLTVFEDHPLLREDTLGDLSDFNQ